ncbi:MAG: DUF4958 family protein [Bacteroidales bacterium]|nr:DUF4958 family protein [Bacteroidales bacterium]
MKQLFNKVIAGLLLAVAVLGACTKNELSDGGGFMLFYPDVTDIGLSYNMNVKPTYYGQTPTDFNVYDITLDGNKCETEAFIVEASTGELQIRTTASMQVGLYSISISCVSGGKLYKFPDAVKVNLMRPVPEGISMDPAELELFVTQVNDVNSLEELPTSKVITEGEHITIKSYHIANVRRDGQALDEWDKFFAIDNAEGVVSIIKNPGFVPGNYVLDLKLLTTAVTMESEEGYFAEALKVAIVSPPVELSYEPAVKRVEEGVGFTSQPPHYVASLKDLRFSLKSVYPEGTPLTIEESTGVITLSEENSLMIGDEVLVSVTLSNAYGTKDFDQVMKIVIVEYIEPISKLSYEDVTMWFNTECGLDPTEVDGDDVRFAFVDLPEALSGLTIDELTGAISMARGNKVPLGEYVVTVKVSNDKGSMTDNFVLKVVENPYFFTKVSWGNNLGLTPASDYASQHRIKGSDAVVVSVDKENSDIKDWDNVRFVLVDGSKVKTSDDKIKYASIDEETGDITLDPSVLTSIDNMRAHVLIVDIISGKGTVGETVCRVPVFFDFNAPRAKSGVPEYTIEYTPFVIQCNPKTGGTFPAPSIKDADGVELADKSHIRMTYRRSANYWNIGGPQTHVNGDPNTAGTFLNLLWNSYYGTSGSLYNNVIPVYSYNKTLDKNIAYIKDDLTLYVAPEKWKLEDGYADGVFAAEVILGYEGKDPGSGVSPYKMYPFLIWFDTEF